MRLQDRVTVITGVSREGQIGQAVAHAFAREGAQLALVARHAERVKARAQEVEALGAKVLPLVADLTREEGVNAMVSEVLKQFGRIDVLVNLAGGFTRFKPATEHTLEDWNTELNNNLLTAFLCSRAVFDTMKNQGGGKIIQFARAGLDKKGMVAYNCAKAGIVSLTRTLALEGRKHNIHVNAVAPGLVDTRDNLEAMKPTPEELAKWVHRDEVAKVVVFLASDEANGIQGQTIDVPGRLF
ncbi:MAG TPA: SDR family NAD(P)-dependent oxidoreductase [Methylococcus sp.]|nr:SDR family NAD(P)-dependent oxidoreductase [Methylococcus sp.]